jgi:thioredoxin reductase
MEAFAAYGMWCVEELVPYVEETEVAFVAARNGGFEITTDAGETQRARRLVLATGLSGLKRIPESLAHLPPELASHTFDNHSYRRYDGMRVAVIGAGASAIEAAVLVHDAGGTATVLVRGDRVIFHGKTDARRSLYQRLRHPDSVLGPGPRNWALEKFPMALHAFPTRFRVPFVKRFLGPASPWWIKERADAAVSVVLGTRVTKAEAIGSGVRLTVQHSGGDDELMEVDHVVCGTGYTFDLDRLGYLDAALCSRMRRVETAPALSRHFESSVPGAYFIGPIAAMSFGPLFRFAAGAEVSAPTVARHLARGSRRAIRP